MEFKKNAEHLWKVGKILQKVGNMERKLDLVLVFLSDIKQALSHNGCIIITWHPTNKESSKQVTSIVSEGIKYLLIKPEMCRLIKLFSSKRCWGERGLREVAEEREGARVEQTRAGGARAGARVERSPTWAPTSPTDRRLAPQLLAPSEGQGSPLSSSSSGQWSTSTVNPQTETWSQASEGKSGVKWEWLKLHSAKKPFSGFVMPSWYGRFNLFRAIL